METIKKVVKILTILSLVSGGVMFVLFALFNLAGVFTIQTLPGTKYENGFTYPGWQAIFFGMGEMMIQGYTEFGFDIYTCLGLFIPLIAIVICTIMYLKSLKKKGKNRKKAILEFVMAGAILFGAIMLFLCDTFSILMASQVEGSYQNYYLEYLLPALNGEVSFKKEIYPYLILIFGILISLIKAGNGGLLIYQKKYAATLKKEATINEK